MQIVPAKGPLYHVGEFFFLYAGFLNDTLFIRISLIIAQFFIALWTCLGVPNWPYITSAPLEGIAIDSVAWGGLCIIVAAIPLIRQFRAMGKQVTFTYEAFTEEAEALWRDWSRRCGMSRADFKMILDIATWLEPDQGHVLSFHFDSVMSENLNEGDIYGDVFYYVVSGTVDCKAHYNEGPRMFQARPGSFLDAFAMLSLLGQPTAGLVMQIGALSARVSEDSEWTMAHDELADYEFVDDSTSVNILQSTPGAMLLRWQREDFIKVLKTPGFCQAHLSLLVTQSTLDSLFRAALPEGPRQRYDAISQARRKRNLSCRNDNSINSRSRWQICMQWWRSAHVSFTDLWRPGPEQRGMNSPRIGSNESIVRTPPDAPMNYARSDLSLISNGGNSPCSNSSKTAIATWPAGSGA